MFANLVEYGMKGCPWSYIILYIAALSFEFFLDWRFMTHFLNVKIDEQLQHMSVL